MSQFPSLSNHFLIAMPTLADPHFSHTVTYICEHNEEGALGIIINRPLPITLGEVLKQMKIIPSDSLDTDTPIHEGGPVRREHGFVIHTPAGAWDTSLFITDEIALSTSLDILSAIAHNEGPQRYFIALGYAGWGAGQLEQEMAQNAWLSGPADDTILFDMPLEQRWLAAAALLGVDLNLLSSEAGHA
jgi:putative transcriptional regulator